MNVVLTDIRLPFGTVMFLVLKVCAALIPVSIALALVYLAATFLLLGGCGALLTHGR